MPILYTVGHSNRTIEDLVALLARRTLATLVDVRAQPYSSRFPHFSTDRLRSRLEHEGMVYHWAGRQLGGRRRALSDSRHAALEERLRGYADYMQTEAFRRAVTQLMNLAAKSPTAVLCAEHLPERCHRRLIADYLTLLGLEVVHLIDLDDERHHQLSPEARRDAAELVYDRHLSGRLDL